MQKVVPQLALSVWNSENSDYSISSAARGMLADLDDVVNVKAYFTSELPGYLLVRNLEVRDLLTEFETVSGGNINVENKSEDFSSLPIKFMAFWDFTKTNGNGLFRVGDTNASTLTES